MALKKHKVAEARQTAMSNRTSYSRRAKTMASSAIKSQAKYVSDVSRKGRKQPSLEPQLRRKTGKARRGKATVSETKKNAKVSTSPGKRLEEAIARIQPLALSRSPTNTSKSELSHYSETAAVKSSVANRSRLDSSQMLSSDDELSIERENAALMKKSKMRMPARKIKEPPADKSRSKDSLMVSFSSESSGGDDGGALKKKTPSRATPDSEKTPKKSADRRLTSSRVLDFSAGSFDDAESFAVAANSSQKSPKTTKSTPVKRKKRRTITYDSAKRSRK